MSTVTSILSTDIISVSRSTINTNYQNLNVGKVESSVLTGSYSTSSTISANFQSKLPYGARAYMTHGSAVQVVPTSSDTKIILDTENWDLSGEFDSTTNYRYTATTAGYYQVNGSIYWQSATSGKFYQIKIFKNGSLWASASNVPGANGDFQCTTSDIIQLAVNDYIELYGFQSTGGNSNVFYGTIYTYLSIQRIF